MGEDNAFNRALWFTIGYLTAVLIDELTEAIIRFLITDEKEPSGTVVLESPNGTTGDKGETVTSLVKETEENV